MGCSLKFSKRIENISTSPTMRIAARAIEMKAAGEDVIDLTVGEPDLPTPKHIKNAAAKALAEEKTKYTLNTGIIELREAISNRTKIDYNIEYNPNEIIVSTGAKQSLFNAVQSLIDDGDEVIVPAPTYVSYEHMIRFANGSVKFIELRDTDNFKLSSQKLTDAISSKSKLLILCNPSNPTGAFHSKEELNTIAEVILENDLHVLSDEIYSKLLYDDLQFHSFSELSNEMKSRTVIVNGVSKSYSMTGWRLGWACGPEEIIQRMAKLQSHTTGNASSVSQYAALAALTQSQDSVEEMRREFQKRRDFIFEQINSINGFETVKPQGAFYVFPDISKLIGKSIGNKAINNSTDFVQLLLEEEKVSVVPGIAFGSENHIRLSFSSPLEVLQKGVNRINRFVSNLK